MKFIIMNRRRKDVIQMARVAAAAVIGLILFSMNARAVEYAGADICAACHADIFAEWKGSLHARAFSSEKFQRLWKENHKKPQCLECHTTGHAAGTNKYQHAGVTCESCHGAMSEGHPGDAKMPIPISSEMCKSCHDKTYKEWKISRHGKKNIRCFDCHKVHGQGLRVGGGEKLCGSCHTERLKDFAHSTHHTEGLECNTCHMPLYPAQKDAIEGTGAAGHALSVGADVCSRCHEEMVHKSANLPDLRGKVTEMNQQMSLAGVESVFDLNEKVSELQWRLNRARQSIWIVAVIAVLAGLSLGWLGGWYLLRKRRNDGPK